MRNEKIMQAARPGKPCLIGRVQHACALAEQVSGCAMGEGRLVLFGTEPGPTGELTLKMRGRETHGMGTSCKVWPVTPGFPEMFQRLSHAGICGRAIIERDLSGLICHTGKMAREAAPRHPFLVVIIIP